MKKKDELKIDAISGIDDRFVDKVSEKRFELFSKKRKPKWIIPSSIAAAVMVVLMVPILMLFITKQAPIYEGMTAHDATDRATIEVYGDGVSFLSAGKSDQGNFEWLKEGDNGNHTGHDKNGENESSSLDVISQDVVYYTHKNTDFYIKVHISNPDNYEILSFTLNGKKYSSYMFEEGSDMETLILKCNAGDAEGIVEYTIDAIKYVDGTAIKDVDMKGERTIKIGVYTNKQPVASVSNEQVGLDYISFDANISDALELIKMSGGSAWVELLKDGSVISKKDISLTESTRVEFDSLDVNTEYEYKVMASFNALDGKGTIDRVLRSAKIETLGIFSLNMSDITQTTASFTLEWNVDVNNKKLNTLALYIGDEKVRELSPDATSLDGLLSGVEYTLIGTYEYEGNTETVKRSFTTVAKAEPTFTLKNISTDMHTVNGDYDMTNRDNTLISYTVKLFKGNELISENTDKKVAFDSLDYYTEYTVRITYTFDVNNGKGVQEKTVLATAKTHPYIDVLECNVANTSAVSEGDTIFMQVTLDNPVSMSVSAVVVNGETYGVTGQSTAERVFVEIVYNGQFAGGDTYLEVDKLIADIDDVTLTVEPETELSANVFINGRLDVLNFEFVNDRFEHIDWAFPSEKVYVMLTIDNSTGYTVDEVVISSSYYSPGSAQIIRIDDNHWYFEPSKEFIELHNGWVPLSLESLSYHNAHANKRLTSLKSTASYYRLASDNTFYVSTPEDLKKMDEGYYYELTGDIDLSGTEWHGNKFNGIFDGKGYSIKNLSYVSTLNESADLGLFTTGTGAIYNVNMEKVMIVAECVTEDNKGWINLHCGSLVARPDSLLVKNCSTDADSFISITCNTSPGTFSVGGLLGYNGDKFTVIIESCVNRASCSAVGHEAFAGGIIGVANTWYNIVIDRCINYGSIAATNSSGGIVGNGDNGGETDGAIISECINYGAVSGVLNAGGISGGGGTVYDCINFGSVSAANNSTGANVGGIAGWGGNSSIFNCLNAGAVTGIIKQTAGIAGNRWNCTIKSCINIGKVSSSSGEHCTIAFDDLGIAAMNDHCYGIIAYQGYEPICTYEQLNSKEFYTATLGWSEDVWDLSDLDCENGKYPKLK